MPENKRITDYQQAYFLGIGGIGMSAIARYLLQLGIPVFGYDKTPTPLTQALMDEGAIITFNDELEALPEVVQNNLDQTLFILTPAIPKNHPQWNWLQSQNAQILKRSEILGKIAQNGYCIAVAGTHGKTTTSTLVAHLLHSCNVNFTAFLGGISSNFGTNYIRKTDGINLPNKGEIIVLEADEFDRSFHRLNPDLAIITAIDPDHLDIYGTAEAFTQAFVDFTHLISKGLLIHESLSIPTPANIQVIQYGKESTSAVHASNIHINNGDFCFDLMVNNTQIAPFRCGLPGHHNVQNAVAALGICINFLQLPIHQLQNGIASFKGAKRRFEYIHKSDRFVVIDDYAHHPEELNAIIGSVKTLYPNKAITGIFQPHLFSRTQDFAAGFAQSLSELDEIYLLNIYPAREQPIPGVNSDWLLSLIDHPKKEVVTPDQVLEKIKNNPAEVLLILGAGDIDRIVQPLAKIYDELEARTQ
jgi:UDP-N-acetylmuramate--alanine ligase